MKSFLAGVLVATVISAGVTYAVASGSTDSITACAHKKTGALRLANGKKCKKSETPMSWPAGSPSVAQGATGAKGETGAIGETGPQGPPGENGSSAAYWEGFSNGFVDPSETRKKMQIIDLPVGTYVLLTNIRAWSATSGNTKASCVYEPVGSGWELGSTFENAVDAGPQGGTISLQTHFRLSVDGSIEIYCANKTGSSHRVNLEGTTYAITVNSVSTFQFPILCPTHNGQDRVVTAVC